MTNHSSVSSVNRFSSSPPLYYFSQITTCHYMSTIEEMIYYQVASYFIFVFFVVIQYFDQIEQYISSCDHLPANTELVQLENCSRKHPYKCASGKHIKRNNTNQIKTSVVVIQCLRISNTCVHVLCISYLYQGNAFLSVICLRLSIKSSID